MAENPGRVTTHEARRLTMTIIIATCLVSATVVAVFGVWYFNSASSGSETVPSLVLQQQDDSRLTFTVNNTLRNDVLWEDVLIRLEATPTDPGASYTFAYWEWRPSTEMLTSYEGSGIAQSMNASTSPDLMIICNLTDITGNGAVNNGDFLTLTLMGNDVVLEGVPCQIMFIYSPSLRTMGSLEFTA